MGKETFCHTCGMGCSLNCPHECHADNRTKDGILIEGSDRSRIAALVIEGLFIETLNMIASWLIRIAQLLPYSKWPDSLKYLPQYLSQAAAIAKHKETLTNGTTTDGA